jgi:hypothetical protein
MAGFLRLTVAGDLCENGDFAFRSLGKGMQDSSIAIDMTQREQARCNFQVTKAMHLERPWSTSSLFFS